VNELQAFDHDVLSWLRPDTLIGALTYLVVSVLLALALSSLLRRAVQTSLVRKGHIDRTTISFLKQFGTALIWVIMIILYAHLIPVLRALGTALLAGASVASVVIGLAAQSTLGNLVAGISITIYKPFRLGDTLQVAAPTGTEVGVVELISLGYTTLRAPAGHLVVLPNALAASTATLNLTPTFAPGAVTVMLRLPRETDLETARRLALEVAHGTPKVESVTGCYLTKIEATGVTLELRVAAADAAGREELRSSLMGALATRFAASGVGTSGAERPSFS
jgi:small conductance mechanosensitive channel